MMYFWRIQNGLFFLSKIWYLATHFHIQGKITSFTLIFIGLVKLILSLWKSNGQETLFAALIFSLGLVIFYKVSKIPFLNDLKNLPRKETAVWILKYLLNFWYNQKIALMVKLQKTKKIQGFLRRRNVKL